jgi:hypothetical protein
LEFDLEPFNSQPLIQKQTADRILECNELTLNFGLMLTGEQALRLADTRNESLSANGRIEFGGGIIDKIIKEFCDSPYISMNNYEETLHELIEIFYYFKNESLDLISDDELIKFMKSAFDGVCQGSLEALSGRDLETLARNLRFGYAADYSEETGEAEDDDGGY